VYAADWNIKAVLRVFAAYKANLQQVVMAARAKYPLSLRLTAAPGSQALKQGCL